MSNRKAKRLQNKRPPQGQAKPKRNPSKASPATADNLPLADRIGAILPQVMEERNKLKVNVADTEGRLKSMKDDLIRLEERYRVYNECLDALPTSAPLAVVPEPELERKEEDDAEHRADDTPDGDAKTPEVVSPESA